MVPENRAQLEDRKRLLLDEIDDYQGTVQAIIGLVCAIRWDESVRSNRDGVTFAMGLALRTSNGNRIQRNHTVTPDLALFADPDYAIVGEAKGAMGQERKWWAKVLKQLEKYDDDCTGWPPGLPQGLKHDLALLIRMERKVDIVDFIEATISEGNFVVTRPFAVVGFARVSKRGEYISLERCYGTLSEKQLDEKLRRVAMIPLTAVAQLDVQMSDARPPEPFLLSLMWNKVFPSLLTYDVIINARKNKTPPLITVTAGQISDKLQQTTINSAGCLMRGCSVPPKKSWVVDALKTLAAYGIATVDGPDTYMVQYRNLQNPLDYFVKRAAQVAISVERRATKREKHDSNGQEELPLWND